MPDTPSPEVAALRAEIDATDDALLELLTSRAAIVERLRESGVKSGHPLRPGREASILRRLFTRHRGPLPRAALFRIWREILASSILQQGGFAVAAQGAEAEALARGQFGLLVPLRVHPTPARALAAVSEGEAQIAVLPAPVEEDGASADWWVALDASRLSVIARLPFLAAPGGPQALVVSGSAPDPSGEDRTLLRFEWPEGASRAAVTATLTAAGLPPVSLMLRREEGLGLAELEGFLTPGDAALSALPFARQEILGAAAVPMPEA